MTIKKHGILTIFRMENDEFEDSEIKNRCIREAETPYIAFALGAQVGDEELLEALEEGKSIVRYREEEAPVVFLSQEVAAGQVDYTGMLEMVSGIIVALLFSKQQICKSGAFHTMLYAKTNYELLCRITGETGKCLVKGAVYRGDVLADRKEVVYREDIPADKKEAVYKGDILEGRDEAAYRDCTSEKDRGADQEVDAEHTAQTLAYVIRHHMNHLHTLGMTDKVFSLFCEYAQVEGIFPLFQQYVNLFLSDERLYEKFARQTAPFIVLRGDDTCGGVLQGFADDLAEGLRRAGQAVIMVDENFTQHEGLQGMVSKGVVGFQSRALEIDFFRSIRGPKFQFWFDNPLRFENVLRRLPEEYYILCQDANYASLIREYYHTPNAIQFPPGGRVPREGLKGHDVPRERPYDMVFMGNYFEDDADALEGFQREFYNHMLRHPGENFEQGLTELLRQEKTAEESAEKESAGRESAEKESAGRESAEKESTGKGSAGKESTGEWLGGAIIEEDAEEFIRLSCSLKPACRMVIGHFRNVVIETILGAGFEIHVYGESWKNYRGAGRERLRIHPYATVEESLQELRKAKTGLNIMSWHKAGMTERIANIMLSGAVCLTEETEYLRQHLREGEEIVTFSLERLEELPAKLKRLLENPGLRERIAEKAYHRAVAEYTWDQRAVELAALAEQAARDTLTIYVATHVRCSPPQDPVYIPLHVGRHGKPDLGYLGDDTGENISDLNFLYGELTGLFWIWQNVHDVDYVGMCHYRRYFINSHRQAMEKREYLELLEQYDAVLPRHMECEGSYYEHYGRSHNIRDLDAVGRALKRIYPSYAEAYDQAMEGSVYYWGNLVVTSLPILKAYAEWLFQIFMEASDEIDVSGYDDYHKRVYGFLSEQMFYVFALANGLKCCEAAVGVSGEKAETGALRDELGKLIGEGRTEEAGKLFQERLKARPDLLLPGSDVNGELQALYRRLTGTSIHI